MALPTANLIAPPVVDVDAQQLEHSQGRSASTAASANGLESPLVVDVALDSPTDTMIGMETSGRFRDQQEQALSDADRCQSSKTLVGWCDKGDEEGSCLDLKKNYQLFEEDEHMHEQGDKITPIQDAGATTGWSSAAAAVQTVQDSIRRRLSSTTQSMGVRPHFGARALTPVQAQLPVHKRAGSDDYLELDELAQVPALTSGDAVDPDRLSPEDKTAPVPPPFESLGATVSRLSALSRQPLTARRKYLLLGIFSCAQFLDIFAGSGALIALADIEESLKMPTAMGTWVINAYAIAFASFLLLAGRISDMYSPKTVFLCGFVTLGVMSIACGASNNAIMMFAFRGLQGAGAAMTIPSALNSIMHVFPEKTEQKRALAVFSSSGAFGSVMGTLLAGVLLLINWRWMFYFVGIGAILLSAVCVVLIPAPPPKKKERGKLDVVGVLLLTSGLVMLIYALTTGSTDNVWNTPGVIAPLVISVAGMLPAFFWWETRISPNDALVPPSTWRLPGFGVLFAVALTIYGWFQSVCVPFTVLWQEPIARGGYGNSAIESALKFLPLGITGGIITIWAAVAPSHFRPKYLLAPAMALCAVGSLLLVFADTQDKYWAFVMPGFVIGCMGGAVAYVVCNIGMMQAGPSDMAGVLGAIYNSALQVGLTAIIAITTAIQSTAAEHYPVGSYNPIRCSFYFIIGVMVCEAIAVALLYREPPDVDGKSRDIVLH